jgi:hypothetical protein
LESRGGSILASAEAAAVAKQSAAAIRFAPQYGVPLKFLVEKFSHVRYPTRSSNCPSPQSPPALPSAPGAAPS